MLSSEKLNGKGGNSSPSIPVCKYFLTSRGNCRYGERCRFQHVLVNNSEDGQQQERLVQSYGRRLTKPPRQYQVNGHAGQPELLSWRSRNANRASIPNLRQDGIAQQHQPITTSIYPQLPIYQGQAYNEPERHLSADQDGRTYDDRQAPVYANVTPHQNYVIEQSAPPSVHFAHPNQQPDIRYIQATTSVRSGHHYRKDVVLPIHSRPCRYFSRGYCKRGEQCEYSHLPDLVGPSAPKSCLYFARGYCRSDNRCPYAHIVPNDSALYSPQNDLNRHSVAGATPVQSHDQFKSVASDEDNEIDDNEDDGEIDYIPEKYCQYDNAELEYIPERECRYGVPVDGAAESDSDDEGSDDECRTDPIAQEFSTHHASEKPSGSGFRSKEELRSIEIDMLIKRIPKEDLQELGDDSFVVNLTATDPDWPYDIRNVKLMIRFGTNYPEVPPVTEIREKDNPLFPPNLTSHLSKSVRGWFEEQHKRDVAAGVLALMFRPFMRWFDKGLEAMFTEGLRKTKRDMEAKAAGLEFVPFENLPGSFKSGQSSAVEQSSTQAVDSSLDKAEGAVAAATGGGAASSGNNAVTGKTVPLNMNDLQSANKGTAIKLCNLRLGENVAAVTCQKLAVTVQCARCKCNGDVRTAPRRRNLLKCSQCAISQYVTFRPSMVHAFDATLGYLDLDDCRAFDLILVECIFAVQCLECLKQLSTDGIHYGQTWFTWCHSCNTKLEMYIGAPKFQVLQPNKIRARGPVDQIKSQAIKKVKNPSIQEGKPLPDCGTCKHYKKSYRWFRFPCCGKAYPCDLCHNEKELEHEMKLANRVICGYCAKEQPFTGNKPCNGCSLSMTNLSKGHWEGGKGCRDKIKMSRDDKQKYAGVAKTVSRKVKEIKENKK